jgi:hypothetical protein
MLHPQLPQGMQVGALALGLMNKVAGAATMLSALRRRP